MELLPTWGYQPELFSFKEPEKAEKLMQALDLINSTFGRNKLYIAGMGKPGEQSWSMKQEHVSPRYTTHRKELVKVLAH
jgi:DNA polymerase V